MNGRVGKMVACMMDEWMNGLNEVCTAILSKDA